MKNEFWPDDSTVAPSVAHAGDYQATRFYQQNEGAIPWTAGKAPDLTCGHNMYTTGRLRSCGYCGSMHPADVAKAILAGAKGHWADFKYGWPHKAYFDGIPNPYVGQQCSVTSMGYGCKKGEVMEHVAAEISSGGIWVQLASSMDREKKEEFVNYPWHKLENERPTTHGKFYSVHLQDATPEDRAVIEKHLGLYFTFKDGKVSWQPWYEKVS